MLVLKSLLLLLTLFQGIKCFCIYNKFTDGTSFIAEQNVAGTPMGGLFFRRTFRQHLEPSANACCHYTNTDCSFNQSNNDLVRFFIRVNTLNDMSYRTFAKCTSGGALFIRGTIDSSSSECIDVNGNSTINDLIFTPA